MIYDRSQLLMTSFFNIPGFCSLYSLRSRLFVRVAIQYRKNQIPGPDAKSLTTSKDIEEIRIKQSCAPVHARPDAGIAYLDVCGIQL